MGCMSAKKIWSKLRLLWNKRVCGRRALALAIRTLLQPFLARRTVSAVIDEHRYLQGYFAVQKAYEAFLERAAGAAVSDIRVPSDVALAANATDSRDSLHAAFEMLLRQRTEVLCSYKQRLEEANAELLNLSITDPLTGLLNRRKFEEVLENEVARARRYGPLSLLMIDLNFFKQVNDRHGHQAGDEMLKSVAQLLKRCCRETDACARLGGDEFAVILPHSDAASAEVVRWPHPERNGRDHRVRGQPATEFELQHRNRKLGGEHGRAGAGGRGRCRYVPGETGVAWGAGVEITQKHRLP